MGEEVINPRHVKNRGRTKKGKALVARQGVRPLALQSTAAPQTPTLTAAWLGPGGTSLGCRPGSGPEEVALSLTLDPGKPSLPHPPRPPGNLRHLLQSSPEN